MVSVVCGGGVRNRRFLTSDFASGGSKSSIPHKAKVYMNNELKKHATTSDSKRSKSKSNLNL